MKKKIFLSLAWYRIENKITNKTTTACQYISKYKENKSGNTKTRFEKVSSPLLQLGLFETDILVNQLSHREGKKKGLPPTGRIFGTFIGVCC